ncbi:hypothetical protein [Desmospora profundinema]|uniref:Uncharacterized protein n=1 Tax=Desmospora profundinema TaxID=1571184 RepID=A0ABU1IIU1_9BACL|nr:hypothetical protein [Desmospora profundinema]MDR6224685.1 hypothetical protein [Desmospora profundinema]
MSMRKGRYYERYQVEDVLTFFSGQLVSAKSPDGTRVFLQEITLNEPLPSGAKEILTNLENEHLAPILDVIEEKERIVLVHPPMGGEPLSLLVQPRRGMEPTQALSVFRRLLRTAINLSELPIPLYTTLDSRNIIIEGNRPFILFVSFEEFTKRQADEKWRFLLHFLLTGFRMESRPENPEGDRSIRELPDALKKLVILSMDPEKSMKDVLEVAEKTVLPKQPKKIVANKRVNTRVVVYSGIVAVVVVAGIFVGNQFTNTPAAAEEEKIAQDKLDQPGGVVSFKDVVFQRQKAIQEQLPPTLQGSFRVQGDLVQTGSKPFSLSLVSENVESDFGLRVDEEGRIVLFQYISGETTDLAKSEDEFQIEPDKEYFVEILYIPGEPFRVAVKDRETKEKWVSVGNVPMDSMFKVYLEGSQGTSFKSPGVAKVEDGDEAVAKWMENQPWMLQGGNGVILDGRIDLTSETRVNLDKSIDSFVFTRPKNYNEDPIRMRLDAVDGSRYEFWWSKDGQMELAKAGAKWFGSENEKLAGDFFGTNWAPDEETRITILNNPDEFGIEVEQGSRKVTMKTPTSSPITIENISIENESWIQLIDK